MIIWLCSSVSSSGDFKYMTVENNVIFNDMLRQQGDDQE
jgi:hypothetical protein